MYDVVCIGSAVRDFFLQSRLFRVVDDPHFVTGEAQCFAFGTKVAIDDYYIDTGGGACNAAVTFARQGLKVAIIARVGDDPSGKEIIAQLKKEKVDTKYLIVDKKLRTASSFILVADRGERTILNYRGASANLEVTDIPFKSLKTKWLYVSSLGGNIGLLEKIVEHAALKNVNLAVNPGKSELEVGSRRLAHVLAGSDVFVVNRLEASLLTGVDIKKHDSITHALCLLTKGFGVVTDGENGAVACDAKNYFQIGVQKVEAVDTTGAGDAFTSGLVAGLIRFGGLVKPALQLAADNASAVVSFLGAKQGILKKSGPKPFKKDLNVKISSIK